MAKKTALMIVPTYNEAKNIGKLLDAIFALPQPAKMGWQLDVLVMDDSSPDGTGDIVAKLAKSTYKGRLYLETGKKAGLGKALRRSFDAALALKHDVILTMDADFSHAPQDIPGLLKGIDDGADVAIGSRYVDGGFIPGNWPLSLIIRTRTATSVARWLGGITREISELTTNFRAMRRHVLQQIDYNGVEARGYGFQIFLANAFTTHDFTVCEVPITFHSRAEGTSKARLKDVLEFFKIAYKLNPDSPAKQVLRFLSVGASGTIVNLAVLWALQNIFNTERTAMSFLAIQASIIWNFSLHNNFTFKAYRKATAQQATPMLLLKNFVRYEAASLLTQAIILAVYTGLTLLGVHFLAAQLTGIVSAFIVNYYLSSTYIWSLAKAYAR